jgi:hypothetical protein
MVNLDEVQAVMGKRLWDIATCGFNVGMAHGDDARSHAMHRDDLIAQTKAELASLLAELQAGRDLRAVTNALCRAMPTIRSDKLYTAYHNANQSVAAYDKAVRDA